MGQCKIKIIYCNDVYEWYYYDYNTLENYMREVPFSSMFILLFFISYKFSMCYMEVYIQLLMKEAWMVMATPSCVVFDG